MSDAQTGENGGEPENRKVWQWMEAIQNGKIALPRFQRGIVWKDQNVCDLFTALVKKRPVGTLLMLQYQEIYGIFDPKVIETFSEKPAQDQYEFLILDGQQRLTALWKALNNSLANEGNEIKKKVFLEIQDPRDSDFKIKVNEVVMKKGNDLKNILNLSEAQLVVENKLVPVDLLLDDSEKGRQRREQWCKKVYRTSDPMICFRDSLNVIASDFNQRDISFYKLPENVSPSEAIETFIKINTSVVKMNDLDVAIASVEGLKIDRKDNLKFRDQVECLSEGVIGSFFSGNRRENNEDRSLQNLIFKISCLLTYRLKGGNVYPPSQGNYKEPEVVKTVIDSWGKIIKGLEYSIEFLKSENIFDSKKLPSEVPLRVLPALSADMELYKVTDSSVKLGIDQLFRKYIWRSFVTSRYNKSADSRLRDDYMLLREHLEKICSKQPLNIVRSPVFKKGNYSLPRESKLSNLKRPLELSRSDKLFKSLMVISLKKGGLDFVSERSASNASKLDYHHLFPQKMLHDEERAEKEINHPLNYALISSNSNNKIGANNPRKYLRSMIKPSSTEADVRKRIESHLIPYDELNVSDGRDGRYAAFIKARAELFIDAIKQLCDGKRYP
ncbi:MAG: DUF262 domain-containing protein [Gammaproteobacteria bacterium AqS3]|nr:DUF262 domain-containing protein [Gammaproteobacteria bacterium AqS3]